MVNRAVSTDWPMALVRTWFSNSTTPLFTLIIISYNHLARQVLAWSGGVSPDRMGVGQIKAGQKPSELFTRYGLCFLTSPRPAEVVFFQSFLPEAEAIFVPVQDLDGVPLSATKNEILSGQGIKGQVIGHQAGQSIDSFAHIGLAQDQPDTGGRFKPEHHLLRFH